MKMLNFWQRKWKRLPAMPAPPVMPPRPVVGKKGPQRSASGPSRARAADTDGRARRRKQLVEDNRLL